jgi:hypothetical protein
MDSIDHNNVPDCINELGLTCRVSGSSMNESSKLGHDKPFPWRYPLLLIMPVLNMLVRVRV